MLIFYVRHGDPIYNPDQLTPLGERQAEAVAKRLALFGVDEIYASTSNRAIQTAQPTCELLGKKLSGTLDFLNENDIGGLQLPVNEKKKSWVWSHPEYATLLTEREVREMGDAWYKHPKLEEFHFENVLHPIYEQIDGFLASHGCVHDSEKGVYDVTNADTEKRIAIFAHECMGKIFMSHVLDIPFPYYASHFEMHTSGLSVVRIDNTPISKNKQPSSPYARAQVLTLSNDSHLYRDGMPLVHRYTGIRERY